MLGAAFKPGSDDVRDSPALDVAQILHGHGAQVTVYDPVAMPSAAAVCPELAYAESASAAAKDAEVVLLLTDWPEFARLRPADLDGVVGSKSIIDARNVLSPRAVARRRLDLPGAGSRRRASSRSQEQAARVNLGADWRVWYIGLNLRLKP